MSEPSAPDRICFAEKVSRNTTQKEFTLRHQHTRKHCCLVRDAMLTGALACVLVVGQNIRPASAHVHAVQAGHGRDHSSHHKPAGEAGGARAGATLIGSLLAGLASVYSGGRTASGEQMHAGGMTAAHRTLPFGTSVTVVNNRNGRAVVVRINDRGPFTRGRVIDLSPAAARAIGVSGLAPVSLTVVGGGS
jgi:rare lipoprotein A